MICLQMINQNFLCAFENIIFLCFFDVFSSQGNKIKKEQLMYRYLDKKDGWINFIRQFCRNPGLPMQQIDLLT